MNRLSELQVRYLLCGAATEPVLIITASEDAAMQIKGDIIDGARSFIWENVNRQYQRYEVSILGYEKIMIMPYKEWVGNVYKLKHKGILLVTSRKIPAVPMTVQPPVMLGAYLAECEKKYSRILKREEKDYGK